MLILGLNAYHGDASACVIRDGEIVAAAEEERFRRIKHWAGLPSESVRYCLAEIGANLSDVDHLAINSNPSANIVRRLRYALARRPNASLIIDRIRNQRKRSSVRNELSELFPESTFRGQVHRVEHHLSHLASCFLVSPFNDAVAVSVDGFGDFASAAWGVGHGTSLSIDGRVWFPHSLGAFYQAVTQYLGFPNYGDEYKIMGLAPYGEPRFISQMRKIVHLEDGGVFSLDLDYFRHHSEMIAYEWFAGSPSVGTIFSPALADLLGGRARLPDEPIEQRHRDIARSVQEMYEEAFFHMLCYLSDRYRLPDITLAGGCAMNSVANGKIRRRSPFKRVYVQSAAGDAGGAIGAAMYVWHGLARGDLTRWRPHALEGDELVGRRVMEHAYLGPGFTSAEISALLASRNDELLAQGCSVRCLDEQTDLFDLTARAIADGFVIGWYQGRMEWGPRALGNRSIVCDPRRADMKEVLNRKIKRRESFRPFAPSIHRERVGEWFEEEADVPFMMQVFQIRAEKRSEVPAVAHVDGSGRLQTVHRLGNPRYWMLIESFRKLTGVPMLLNTSFNENEPVVCRPEEALDCFLRTKMDVLVLNEWFIQRSGSKISDERTDAYTTA